MSVTEILKQNTPSCIKNFARKILRLFKVLPREVLKIEESKIALYKTRNRESLDAITDWVDQTAFDNSYFKYGVHEHFIPLLAKPINNETSYSDVICYLSGTYFKNPTYLEIGVSVGKNFWQILNSPVTYSKIYGFDIESINPIVENFLEPVAKESWATNSTVRTQDSLLTTYKYKDREHVSYLSADVWDEKSWEALRVKGLKFDVVFSDAEHSPEAILHEFEMLKKYGLLADKFVVIWDDIRDGLEESFYKIFKDNKKELGLKEYSLLRLNGWLGQHVPPPHPRKHPIGVIANFKF